MSRIGLIRDCKQSEARSSQLDQQSAIRRAHGLSEHQFRLLFCYRQGQQPSNDQLGKGSLLKHRHLQKVNDTGPEAFAADRAIEHEGEAIGSRRRAASPSLRLARFAAAQIVFDPTSARLFDS
jgi:hypothetical protein